MAGEQLSLEAGQRELRPESMRLSAEAAAALIPPGANVGMSGFTGSGYPKLVPGALAL